MLSERMVYKGGKIDLEQKKAESPTHKLHFTWVYGSALIASMSLSSV